MNNFKNFPLSALLQSNLATNNFTEPTPVQSAAIEPALAGKDIVATAQTGTGKTLAFVLPLIHRLQKEQAKGVRAVVLTPTRELAMQIHEVFVKMAAGSAVRAAVIVGGVGERPQLNTIRKGAQVLIATPGRLYDYLSRKLVDLSGVRMIVLDEADRMLDMGFLPTVSRILDTMPEDRQTLLFSATIESSIKHLIDTYVRDAVRIEITSTTRTADKVDLHLYEVESEGKFGLLTSMLQENEGSFLVFARTKRGAEKLSNRLSRDGGVKTTAIHGDRSQNQRNQALKGFQDGYYRVLVATDVAARGIHVEGISHVVNYDLPQAPEDFIHRVGRTGRAGAAGVASTFATRAERSEIARIERTLNAKLVRQGAAANVVEIAPRNVRSFGSRRGRPSRGPVRRQLSCVV
jgi:ATP-dependent RNA helicase RhlE